MTTVADNLTDATAGTAAETTGACAWTTTDGGAPFAVVATAAVMRARGGRVSTASVPTAASTNADATVQERRRDQRAGVATRSAASTPALFEIDTVTD